MRRISHHDVGAVAWADTTDEASVAMLPDGYDISGYFTCEVFLTIVRQSASVPNTGPIYQSHVAEIGHFSSGMMGDKLITSLDGIEFLTALTSFYIALSQITTLDLSNNTELIAFAIYNGPLTTLNVSNNPALIRLHTGNNQLTTLDISNNPVLRELVVVGTQLTTLDISNNPALRWLLAAHNQLTSLDLSNNPVLDVLYVENNFIASPDDIIGWQDLFPEYDWSINLGAVGFYRIFSFSPQIQNITPTFTCPNFLSHIRTLTNRPDPLPISQSHVQNITQISAPNHNIQNLSGIQYFTNLENLIVQGNNLTELDLSGLHNLRHLNASNNNLTTLDISDATALTALSISRNNISTITGLDTLANLEVFWAESNAFASLDFHPNAPLERIDARGNTPPLSPANITGATAVTLQDYDPAGIFRPRTWTRLRILSGLAL